MVLHWHDSYWIVYSPDVVRSRIQLRRRGNSALYCPSCLESGWGVDLFFMFLLTPVCQSDWNGSITCIHHEREPSKRPVSSVERKENTSEIYLSHLRCFCTRVDRAWAYFLVACLLCCCSFPPQYCFCCWCPRKACVSHCASLSSLALLAVQSTLDHTLQATSVLGWFP